MKCPKCHKKMRAISTDGICMDCWEPTDMIVISSNELEVSTEGWNLPKEYEK